MIDIIVRFPRRCYDIGDGVPIRGPKLHESHYRAWKRCIEFGVCKRWRASVKGMTCSSVDGEWTTQKAKPVHLLSILEVILCIIAMCGRRYSKLELSVRVTSYLRSSECELVPAYLECAIALERLKE